MKLELQRLCVEEIKISARADQFEKNVANDKVVMPLVRSVEIAGKKIEQMKPVLEELEMGVLVLKVEKTEAASEVEIRKERMKKLMVSLIEPRGNLEVLREKHENAKKSVEFDLSELQATIDAGEMKISGMEFEIGDLKENMVTGKIELDKIEKHNSRLIEVLEIKNDENDAFRKHRDLITDSIKKAEKNVQTEKERLKMINKTWTSELEKLENPKFNPDLSNLILDLEKSLRTQQKLLTIEETKDIGLVHYERRKISAENEYQENHENLSLEIKPVLSENVKNLDDLKVQFERVKKERERLTQEQTEAIKIAFGKVELEQRAREQWEMVCAEAAGVERCLRDEVEGNTEFKEVATELRKLRMNEQVQKTQLENLTNTLTETQSKQASLKETLNTSYDFKPEHDQILAVESQILDLETRLKTVNAVNVKIVDSTGFVLEGMENSTDLVKVIRKDMNGKEGDLQKILVRKTENERTREVVQAFILSEMNIGLAGCCKFDVDGDLRSVKFGNVLRKFEKERDILDGEIKKFKRF